MSVATAELTGRDGRKLAYVFPGEGSQYVGMGKALYEASCAARGVFQQADEILGFKLSQLCFEGPAEELEDTINAQPAILTASIAALRAAELGTSVIARCSEVRSSSCSTCRHGRPSSASGARPAVPSGMSSSRRSRSSHPGTATSSSPRSERSGPSSTPTGSRSLPRTRRQSGWRAPSAPARSSARLGARSRSSTSVRPWPWRRCSCACGGSSERYPPWPEARPQDFRRLTLLQGSQ